jgi:hypothetical protein
MSQLMPSSQFGLGSTLVDSEGELPILYVGITFGHGGTGIGTTMSTSISNSHAPSGHGDGRGVTLTSPPSPKMQPA